MSEKNASEQNEYGDCFARELARPVGKELAERIGKNVPDMTAEMTRADAIARAAVVRAMEGDNTAVKYLFKANRRKGIQNEIPFIVEHVVVDDEI